MSCKVSKNPYEWQIKTKQKKSLSKGKQLKR